MPINNKDVFEAIASFENKVTVCLIELRKSLVEYKTQYTLGNLSFEEYKILTKKLSGIKGKISQEKLKNAFHLMESKDYDFGFETHKSIMMKFDKIFSLLGDKEYELCKNFSGMENIKKFPDKVLFVDWRYFFDELLQPKFIESNLRNFTEESSFATNFSDFYRKRNTYAHSLKLEDQIEEVYFEEFKSVLNILFEVTREGAENLVASLKKE